MTLDGDTEAATLACWEVRADCTAGGTDVPAGRLSPSAHSTRMASTPERKLGFPSGFPGVGVVDRVASSSARKLVTEAFLLLPNHEAMLIDTGDSFE